MSFPRFTVAEAVVKLGKNSWSAGGAVHDRGKRITIPFASYHDAEQHRDNIAKLYARFGW